jgi:cell division cycle 14
MSWIIPNKLLAFASPADPEFLMAVPTADELVPILRDIGISHIVRLCEPLYDMNDFLRKGFTFTDLSLKAEPDFESALEYFARIVASIDIVAVHCKTGLSRTATMIAAYLIRKREFSAPAAIAWMRICRPGSISGTAPNSLFRISVDFMSDQTVPSWPGAATVPLAFRRSLSSLGNAKLEELAGRRTQSARRAPFDMTAPNGALPLEL